MNEILTNLITNPVLLLVTVGGVASVVSIVRTKGRVLRARASTDVDTVVYNPTTGAYVQPFALFDADGNVVVR
ncbi:hypothetical protein [Burkholderia anthina]|uniref:hypothetical protein n=1 Tax=Burkholderia anthina TaxID=179879 RepID=UPI0037BE9D13